MEKKHPQQGYMVESKKLCPRCKEEKLLTEENFYPARPRLGRKAQGWQSYCRPCWKHINKENKERYFARLRELRSELSQSFFDANDKAS
jgi:hypothetical protein